MKIQHNSMTKIEKVESFFGEDLLGCLCFGEEGHDYNLAQKINYRYILDIDEDNSLDMERIWFCHDSDKLPAQAEDIIQEMMDDLNCDRDRILDFLDASDTDCENGTIYSGFCAGWYIQQNMGLIAHALGYDAAVDEDEQGTVYVVYCIDKELQEV